MARVDLSRVKPASISAFTGWRAVDHPTPWGRRVPESHRFTQAELDAFWEAQVASGFRLEPSKWWAAQEK